MFEYYPLVDTISVGSAGFHSAHALPRRIVRGIVNFACVQMLARTDLNQAAAFTEARLATDQCLCAILCR